MKQLPDQVDKLQEAIQAAYEKNVTCYNISRSESISGPAPDLNLSVTNKVSGYYTFDILPIISNHGVEN